MDGAEQRARRAAAARARRQDPAVRVREAAAKRARRLADLETVRANDAARQRALRAADPERRAREAAAKRARRLADLDGARVREAATQRRHRSRIQGADARDRLWFDNNLTAVSGIRNEQNRAAAIAVLRREFPGGEKAHSVLLRRCPCGQVSSSCTSSQASGWVVRREVSTQCGLKEMPPLPLPLDIFQSSTSSNSEEGTSWDQAGRLSDVFHLSQKETDHATGEESKSQKLFECPLCQYSTPRFPILRLHLERHSTEKPYKCEVCAAPFKCLQSYKAHMCKHTGEKPYQCHLCPYSTAYPARLVEHKRAHSNARPFACTMCAYRCNCKSNLLAHLRKHTGNAPFKCKVCNLGFGREHFLKAHMRQHLVS